MIYSESRVQVASSSNGTASSLENSAWGAVINFERQGKADTDTDAEAKPGSRKGARYIVDVLANCAPDTVPGHGPKR